MTRTVAAGMRCFLPLVLMLIGPWSSYSYAQQTRELNGVVRKDFAGAVSIDRPGIGSTSLTGPNAAMLNRVLKPIEGFPVQLSVPNAPRDLAGVLNSIRVNPIVLAPQPAVNDLSAASNARLAAYRSQLEAIAARANGLTNDVFQNWAKQAFDARGFPQADTTAADISRWKMSADTLITNDRPFAAWLDNQLVGRTSAARPLPPPAQPSADPVSSFEAACSDYLKQADQDDPVLQEYILGYTGQALDAADPSRRAVEFWRARLTPRSQYGGDDAFPVCSYKRLTELARTVVYLKRGEQHCTGFLVAPTLVMTAAHCLARKLALPGGGFRTGVLSAAEITGFVARFDGGSKGAVRRNVARVLFPIMDEAGVADIVAKLAYTSDLPDIALLELEEAFTIEAADGPILAPLCQNERPEEIAQAFVTIGYQENDRLRIFDNARTLMPYRVEVDVRDLLVCRLGGPLWRAKASLEAAKPDDKDRRERIIRNTGAILQSIRRAYVRPRPDKAFLLMHPGYDSRRGMPAFVFDPDVSGGVSGGSVIDRRALCVRGVFSASLGDHQIQSANWFAHEVATPVEAGRAAMTAAAARGTAQMTESGQRLTEALKAISALEAAREADARKDGAPPPCE